MISLHGASDFTQHDTISDDCQDVCEAVVAIGLPAEVKNAGELESYEPP